MTNLLEVYVPNYVTNYENRWDVNKGLLRLTHFKSHHIHPPYKCGNVTNLIAMTYEFNNNTHEFCVEKDKYKEFCNQFDSMDGDLHFNINEVKQITEEIGNNGNKYKRYVFMDGNCQFVEIKE